VVHYEELDAMPHRPLLYALLALVCSGLLTAASASAQSEPDMHWYEGEEGRSAQADDSAFHTQQRPGEARSGARGYPAFGLGFALAYQLPAGDFTDDNKLSRYIQGAFRPALDLHAQLSPALGFGVYSGVGFGMQSDYFDRYCSGSGVTCSLYTVDFGAFGEYRLFPRAVVTPWLQLNVGYEHYRNNVEASASFGGLSVSGAGSFRAHGIGFGATLGADAHLGGMGLGPFFSAQFGSYRKVRMAFDNPLGSADDSSADIDHAMHYLLQLGVRARYELL
jgi:hypothetical protein